MYKVRLSVDNFHKNFLDYINFSEANNGILYLSIPENQRFEIMEVRDSLSVLYPIKFETFIDGNHCIGLISQNKMNIRILDKIVMTKSIDGTVDNLKITLSDKIYGNNRFDNKDANKFIKIEFMTLSYFDNMSKGIKGIKSDPVNIEVYVDGKFKPHSKKQQELTGYKVSDKGYNKYKDNTKFYELDYKSEFNRIIDNI